MKVIEFLNRNFEIDEFCTLDKLKEVYGIKYSYNDTYELFVLNYDQIESAKQKFDPIVCECRSLVVQFTDGRWEVVSRSFDRFFNYGESQQEFAITSLKAYEKLDGSLVSVFYHKGVWLYRTKSMIMPVTEINGLDVTWKDLIDPFINREMLKKLDELCGISEETLICELVAPQNRVVVRYQEPKLRLLAVRNNELGFYMDSGIHKDLVKWLGWELPRTYEFDSWDEAIEASKELPNLEEGFVFYNEWDVPVIKLKNPAYVAAHHLRGEGVLNPKRICDLIIMGEVDEYLSVFPEDDEMIAPYVLGHRRMQDSVQLGWKFYGRITDQKEFAMKVKDGPFASLLFSMKKGLNFQEAWDKLTQNAKREMIIRGMAKSVAPDGDWRE